MSLSWRTERSRSRSVSSVSSTSDSVAESWKGSKRTRQGNDTETETAYTSSAPSPTPGRKSDTQSSEIDEAKTSLPTPFWPVSLQYPRLRLLKETGGDQGPSLPEILPSVPKNETPDAVVDVDLRTPDSWMHRNPELIRLTGKHPLNTEGKLSDVFNYGFLTPAHLHFVRNHGPVPNLPPPHIFLSSSDTVPEGPEPSLLGLSEAAKASLPLSILNGTKVPTSDVDVDPYVHWSIRIHGLVAREVTMTIKELAEKFQVVTLPVTLVCAGNRRKEQNVVRKSLGFDWGAAGLSTALWTGVYLADMLEFVQPIRPTAKHVIFEGADQLPKGPYGTSQRLSWAADKMKGMLIAWAMNGLPLEPDHGFPIRLIVPGQIGGRMVKWLTRIEISEVESNHYLHYWDNKVLPMQLTPEQARQEPQWWYDPKYVITELNVNSAIAYPAHGETLTVTSQEKEGTAAHGEGKTYAVRGYAYAGGGRRITRVELSWDDGVSWQLADIEYPEDSFRSMGFEHPVYGLFDLTQSDMCFCWCFWTIKLPFYALARADSLAVRAMDEGMNTQPRDMYLNATSMLNNWWFRIAISRTRTESGEGVQLYFEHPAVVGTTRQGWMDRMKAEGKNILRPSFSPVESSSSESSKIQVEGTALASKGEVRMIKPGVDRKISAVEIQAQDKEKPWFVVNGEVYDATGYLKDHPGGADSILLVAGEDATDDFMAIHSSDAKKKLAELHIGTLSGKLDDVPSSGSVEGESSDAPFLNPKSWKPIVLTAIDRINHDSLIYRFALPSEDKELGLPVGQHVFVRLKRKDTDDVVQRAYTPVSGEDVRGTLDFLIKLYLPSDEFPLGGKMTVGFHQLEVGDSVEVKGPLGSFIWQGAGNALWKGVPRKLSNIGLVCGGSGITPILQVIRSVLHDKFDHTTQLYLISSNKTEVDILCREELDTLLHSHSTSGRFHLHYTLGRPPAERWSYSAGRVNVAMLREYLPPPGEGNVILACGPPAMVEGTVREGLRLLDWDVDKDFFVF